MTIDNDRLLQIERMHTFLSTNYSSQSVYVSKNLYNDIDIYKKLLTSYKPAWIFCYDSYHHLTNDVFQPLEIYDPLTHKRVCFPKFNLADMVGPGENEPLSLSEKDEVVKLIGLGIRLLKTTSTVDKFYANKFEKEILGRIKL